LSTAAPGVNRRGETLMEGRDFRRLRVIRTVAEPIRLRRNEVAFVEIPAQWAGAVASVIKMSDEYRNGGLLVTNVGPASHAGAAGIGRGDVLLRADGISLDSVESLRRLTSRADGNHKSARGLTVEGLRGAQEITFKPAQGRLGITVSPLLHRSGHAHRSERRATQAAGAPRAVPKPRAADQSPVEDMTLVEVPGHLLANVLLLKRMIARPANAKQRKDVTALLASAARLA
jgi:membrane-associated protease RseP (regulator of RpoE activity)